MIARTVLGKILVFSVFFIGIVTGAALDTAYRTRVTDAVASNPERRGGGEDRNLSPQERAKRDLERMATYLGLDASQKEKIGKIQEESAAEFNEARQKASPEFKALREKAAAVDAEFRAVGEKYFKGIQDKSRTRISEVLTDEQRRKWEEFRAKRDAQRGNGGRGGRPGPRPGNDRDRSDKSDKQ